MLRYETESPYFVYCKREAIFGVSWLFVLLGCEPLFFLFFILTHQLVSPPLPLSMRYQLTFFFCYVLDKLHFYNLHSSYLFEIEWNKTSFSIWGKWIKYYDFFLSWVSISMCQKSLFISILVGTMKILNKYLCMGYLISILCQNFSISNNLIIDKKWIIHQILSQKSTKEIHICILVHFYLSERVKQITPHSIQFNLERADYFVKIEKYFLWFLNEHCIISVAS